MSSKPPLVHQATSATLPVPVEPKNTGENVAGSLNEKSSDSGVRNISAPATPLGRRRLYDILLLLGILVMLIWPWVFFGVVFALGGIQASNEFATEVTKHPHTVSFFCTFIANVITVLIDILFSFSIVRFAQEWVSDEKEVTDFHITLMAAFRHHSWPWKLDDLRHPFIRSRWLLVSLVGACLACFTFVPASITSLITPVPFNRTAVLTGRELDFSSTAPDCTSWFAANPLSNICDWEVYKGLRYTSCLGENQMVDVLEAGRGNILSLLSNNTQSLSFSQLSAGGLHFLGPIRGVLPMGPNGVPAFDTLNTSPLSIPSERSGMLSYNYTLDHQGFTSNVSCMYDTSSPIAVGNAPRSSDYVFQYNGTCAQNGMEDVFPPNKSFVQILSNNTMAFWTCKSQSNVNGQVDYFVYFRGTGAYRQSVGSMTCAISPIQPAIFNVTYQSEPNIFSIMPKPISTSPNAFTALLDQAMIAVGGVVWEAQNWESNLVAESVLTFGVKNFNLSPNVRDDLYLRLYEAMIQGIIEYEITYSRLLYSASDRPQSCTRVVTGSTSFQVVGWSADIKHIGFLMPITSVNIAALVILITAMVISKSNKNALAFNPTDIRPLLLAFVPEDPEMQATLSSWGRRVKYHREASKDVMDRGIEKAKDQGAVGAKDVWSYITGAFDDCFSSAAT